jgi:hypothetical protein
MHYHVYITRRKLRVTEYIGIIDLTLPTSGDNEIAFEHAGERIRAKVVGAGKNKNPNGRADGLPPVELEEL